MRTQHGPTWEVCIGDVLEEPVPVAEGTQGTAYGAAEGSYERSQAMAVWTASLLAPIAAELGAARQPMARQAETIRGQAEMIGSLTEQVDGRERELDRPSAEIAALSGQLADAEVSRRRYVGIANALVIVLAVVVALAFAATAWLP